MYLPAATINTKRDMSDVPRISPQNKFAPPRWDRGCQNTCLDVSLAYFYRSVLSREQMRLALSKLEKNVLRLHSLVGSEIRLVSWLGCVIYFTDQLMTPYFSGGCTLNGTPGGDRWGRVLCEEIGWLSEPLHRFDAVCSGSTNLNCKLMESTKKSRPTKNTPRNVHQPRDRDHLETASEKTCPTR